MLKVLMEFKHKMPNDLSFHRLGDDVLPLSVIRKVGEEKNEETGLFNFANFKS